MDLMNMDLNVLRQHGASEKAIRTFIDDNNVPMTRRLPQLVEKLRSFGPHEEVLVNAAFAVSFLMWWRWQLHLFTRPQITVYLESDFSWEYVVDRPLTDEEKRHLLRFTLMLGDTNDFMTRNFHYIDKEWCIPFYRRNSNVKEPACSSALTVSERLSKLLYKLLKHKKLSSEAEERLLGNVEQCILDVMRGKKPRVSASRSYVSPTQAKAAAKKLRQERLAAAGYYCCTCGLAYTRKVGSSRRCDTCIEKKICGGTYCTHCGAKKTKGDLRFICTSCNERRARAN